LAKYGAGRWNFILSNIAGLVRGRTVFDWASLVVSTSRFNLSSALVRPATKSPHFANADRCGAMVAELKNKAGLGSAAIRKVFES
jgi:hypothetical protein